MSGASNSTLRLGSLNISRSGESFQIQLDLPPPGGVRSSIWSGSSHLDERAKLSIELAVQRAGASMAPRGMDQTLVATRTLLDTSGPLEQLGRMMFREILPDVAQDELAGYSGGLVLTTNDASLPWELLHDGQDALALRIPIGRSLIASRRRRSTDPGRRPSAQRGFLVVGNPTGRLDEAEREIAALGDLLGRQAGFRVLRGAQATRETVLRELRAGEFATVHFVGELRLGGGQRQGLWFMLADGQAIGAADFEEVLQGDPFVFLHGQVIDAPPGRYQGVEVQELAASLANAGTRGFVGTLWPSYGPASRQVAVEFYRKGFEGTGAGEALRQARTIVRARRGDEPTWAAFAFYGDPTLSFVPAGAEPTAETFVVREQARFGPFVLDREIGRGGMGVVWRAYQASLDRYVAIKFMPAVVAADETNRERFKREARMVARMRHPNILTVHDFGELQGQLFLVTEYVPGGTFQDVLKSEGRLPVARALQLLRPVASALDHVHAHQVVHRDVKPSNILLGEEG
ncbi:MAG: CHAT domain-containing protein, partial [Chloroflexi bacterium]|nr:CHAT domain-containing protein [Chloroflexota bacterium]